MRSKASEEEPHTRHKNSLRRVPESPGEGAGDLGKISRPTPEGRMRVLPKPSETARRRRTAEGVKFVLPLQRERRSWYAFVHPCALPPPPP